MIETYASEFVAIVSFLQKQDTIRVKNKILIVEKPLVCDLLNRNMYEMADVKLAVWRGLHWIDSDADNRFTKKVMINGHSSRAVHIDLAVSETLSKLLGIHPKKP